MSATDDNRFKEHNLTTQLMSMAMMLYSIPAKFIAKTEAVVVFPGLGESRRVHHAIKIYQENFPKTHHLIVAGHNPSEKLFEDFSLEGLKKEPFNLVDWEVLITTDHAENTLDQCRWVRDTVKNHGLKSLTLTASPYHLVRAYLTLLKTFLKSGMGDLPFIVPSPTIISPSEIIPETGITAWEMSPAEIGRIITYQEKGDVASFDELHNYLDYFWKHFQ